MISVRAQQRCVHRERRLALPLAAALPIMPAERRALERFILLEAGGDHDAYLAVCKAACRAGPDAFNILCDVTLRGLPVKNCRGAELLQAAAHELVGYFAALDARPFGGATAEQSAAR